MSSARRAFLVAGLGFAALSAGALVHGWRLGWFSNPEGEAVHALFQGPYTDLAGKPLTLTGLQLQGKVLIINYWATWCAPCREEIPLFVRIQEEFADKNIQFVGISIDQADKIREFAQEFKINYPLAVAGIEAIETSRRIGNKAGVLPYTVIIDRSGKVAERMLGAISETRLRQTLKPLI